MEQTGRVVDDLALESGEAREQVGQQAVGREELEVGLLGDLEDVVARGVVRPHRHPSQPVGVVGRGLLHQLPEAIAVGALCGQRDAAVGRRGQSGRHSLCPPPCGLRIDRRQSTSRRWPPSPRCPVCPSWSPATEMVALDGRRVTSHAIEGPRSATPADVAEIIALVDAEMRAGTHQTLLTDYPLVYAPANLRNVQVIAVDGRIVSVVPFLPRRIRFGAADIGIAIISPTATEPAYRHQGLASRCLESCLDRMREADCLLSALWTRERTFPFYERAGYRAIASQAFRYRLSPEDATRFAIDPRVRLEPLDPTDQASLDRIQRIHERDGDGIHREASEYRPLFSLPVMQTLVARRDGLLVGYAIISAAPNKPGLIEAGGDRPADRTCVPPAP